MRPEKSVRKGADRFAEWTRLSKLAGLQAIYSRPGSDALSTGAHSICRQACAVPAQERTGIVVPSPELRRSRTKREGIWREPEFWRTQQACIMVKK
jgi:hypothetical protein